MNLCGGLSVRIRAPILDPGINVQGLFGKNETVPLGDHFYSENDLLHFEAEAKGSFIWGNETELLYPNRL